MSKVLIEQDYNNLERAVQFGKTTNESSVSFDGASCGAFGVQSAASSFVGQQHRRKTMPALKCKREVIRDK